MVGSFVLFASVNAQNRIVTGKITGANNVPLETATIQIKGSKSGTTASNDGSFTITVPKENTVIIVSSVGYVSQEINLAGKSSIDVSLKSTDSQLEEVLVVAYGTVKKSDFTGSAGIVDANAIAKQPVTNVANVLDGKIPGVVVANTSGAPGSGPSIRVRGFGSFSADQTPLIVLDGTIYTGGLSSINPYDVESLTVLKDASSTALYGSRAGNGVVLITTKKGKKGRNNISFRALQGVSSRGVQEYSRVNEFEYYPLMWEAYRNSLVYRTGGISLDSASRVASGLTNRDGIDKLLSYNPFNVARNQIVGVDGKINPNAQLLYPEDREWTDFFMSNGTRKEYNLNFNGGADKSDYYLSSGYLKENGFTTNTDIERYTARLNVNINPKSWIKTGLNISGNYSIANLSNEGNAIANPFSFSRGIGPIYPYYAHNMTTGNFLLDENGNRIHDLGNFENTQFGIDNGIKNRVGTSFTGRHAPRELELNIDKYRRMAAGLRQYVTLNFTKALSFTSNAGIDYISQDNVGYENTIVGDGAPAGRTDKSNNINQVITLTQLLNYKNTFGRHGVDAIAGHETYDQKLNDIRGFKQGQSLTGNTQFGNFTTVNTLTSSEDRYKTESFFGRLNYDYNNLFNISGSLRADGNSRFAPDSRWGTFGSVGVGVALHKLPGIRDQRWINSLKLRSSYGTVGVADGIGYYAWQGLYGFGNNALEPGIVQSQTQFENRDLSWEVNKQTDIGLDFSVLSNRLRGSVEYFNRVSTDLLFAVPTALSTGALSSNKNTASLYNRGFELGITGDLFRSQRFIWTMGVNLTTIKNEITKMPEAVPEFISGTKKYSVGASLYDYWIRSYYGVDPDDGSVLYKANNTTASSGIRYKNNKGGGMDTLTTASNNALYEYQGGVIPKYYGSMTQTITYLGFTLTAQFTFQRKGLTYDGAYQGLMSAGTYGSSIHKDVLRRWQKPGDITDVPRMDNAQTTNFNANSSRWLIDASYFNIRSINFSYDFPRSLLSKTGLSGVSVFMSAENVANFTKRKGMYNQGSFSGVTGSNYPVARIISAGLNINL